MPPDDELARLQSLAAQFRTAIEATLSADFPEGMQTFPCLACGDSALLLARWLKELGLNPTGIVQGYNGTAGHSWLMVGDIYVDITADQFHDGKEVPYATRSSDWHKQFSARRETYDADWPDDDNVGMEGMHAAYRAIREHIETH
ncbi:hypothetical protein ACOTD8_06480 [Achromobacter dolens]|uniref:hypothetical protein n=1 Tax=Achromobacter dolens TaxID=1287738 RepID=UPI003B9A0D18